jgi:hypothetical protein
MRWPWNLSEEHGWWRSAGRKRLFIPHLEYLEDRFLPAWSAIGPAPQLDSLNAQLPPWPVNGMPASGRISALATVAAGAQQTLYLGSASAGEWLSMHFDDHGPADTPWTDKFDRNNMAAGALDTGTTGVPSRPEARDTGGTVK